MILSDREILPSLTPTLLFSLAIGFYLIFESALSDEAMFHVLIAALAIYLAAEVLTHAQRNPQRWMISPPVLASIFTFVLGFCATPITPMLSAFVVLDISKSSNYALVLALVASYAMWCGFNVPIGSRFVNYLFEKSTIGHYFNVNLEPSRGPIIIISIVSIVARLAEIWLGIYGYNATVESATEALAYKQFLYYLDSGGKLALIAIALGYFSSKDRRPRDRILLSVLLVVEVVFGILSGFKGAIILPVVLLGIVQYLQQGRVSRGYIMAALALLVLGYALIQPYRVLRYENPAFRNDSVEGIASEMMDVIGGREFGEGVVETQTLAAILERGDLLMVTSRGLEFADEGPFPEDAPEFMGQILLSPLLALIPRFLWPDKPREEIGGWFNQVVLGQREDSLTSVGMGPIVYLYFAGGSVMVILGFFLIGILQRFAGELILIGGGAALIGFAILRPLILVDSAYNTILVSLIREVALVFIAQAIIFRQRGAENAEHLIPYGQRRVSSREAE